MTVFPAVSACSRATHTICTDEHRTAEERRMRTFRASAIVVVAVCRATAFNVYPRQFKSSLEPASHHSFCSRTWSYASATLSRQRLTFRCRGKRARADPSTGGASLLMFGATDLFQLQQWAGDISATEVRRCGFSSAGSPREPRSLCTCMCNYYCCTYSSLSVSRQDNKSADQQTNDQKRCGQTRITHNAERADLHIFGTT